MPRVALVTGGASGIGLAVVRNLLERDWRVVVGVRDVKKLASLKAEMAGRDVLGVQADVTDPSSVRELVGEAATYGGRLDLLFNNAGVFGPSAPIDEVDFADWQAVVDVNLNGAFLCAREAFRLMRRQSPQGGRIINNGSLSAHVPRPSAVAYTATKHAITGLTKAISLDGREHSIACGQIDIGNAASAMTEGASRGLLQADGAMVVEPTIDVTHVAEAVGYMASLPLDANVQFISVMATRMPFIGRG